jgi:hypothetical protein
MNWVLVLLWCATNQYCVPVVMPSYYNHNDCSLVGKKATGDGKFSKYFCVQKSAE